MTEPVEGSAEAPDLTRIIRDEHAAIAGLFDALGTTRHDRFPLAHRLIDELVAHTAVEHQILYPALRDIVPGGVALANEGQAAHRVLRVALEALEASHPGDAEFEQALTALGAELATHVPAEEDTMLPALREVIGAEAMTELGGVYRQLREAVPSGLQGLPADLPEPRFRPW